MPDEPLAITPQSERDISGLSQTELWGQRSGWRCECGDLGGFYIPLCDACDRALARTRT